jgi:hypothetical protein
MFDVRRSICSLFRPGGVSCEHRRWLKKFIRLRRAASLIIKKPRHFGAGSYERFRTGRIIGDIVRNPKFICKKCGRVADEKKWLPKSAALI